VSAKTHNVVIAGYATIDAAKNDFEALTNLVESEKIKTNEGVILVKHDHDGKVHVTDSADHHGRKGLAWGGGVGLVVGLFAPPLLASVVVGAAAGGLIGKFVKHRLENGIAGKVGETIPIGMAGIITLVAADETDEIRMALASGLVDGTGTGQAVKLSVVGVDGDGIKALKEGLIESASDDAKRA
jgi:arylsulfatase